MDAETHAREQAQAKLEGIKEAYNATQALENGADSVDYDGETYTDADELRERVEEEPLEVCVRSAWHTPGGDSEPVEYYILLCYGGPAVRIVGELGDYSLPTSARLQYQHWGIPWSDYIEPGTRDALMWYAGLFYYGD